jgi:hypothetical protein
VLPFITDTNLNHIAPSLANFFFFALMLVYLQMLLFFVYKFCLNICPSHPSTGPSSVLQFIFLLIHSLYPVTRQYRTYDIGGCDSSIAADLRILGCDAMSHPT